MEPQVSVITVFYNSSKYIERCCNSLFCQTLPYIQYIFVDDGSVDNSKYIIEQVLERYPSRKNQVEFLSSKDNHGVGGARNAGLKRTKGEYITHCDSDDWVEPTLYEKLYKKAKETNADIVTCGYYVDAADNKLISSTPPVVIVDSVSFSISPQTGALWNKLIKRTYIENNKLEIPSDITWGEDLCLSLKALLLTKEVQSYDDSLYHHVVHEDSLTHDVSYSQCLDLVKCALIIEDFLKEHSLLEAYILQLNWLKFQSKQYFLIFPHTRDIEMWKSIYPECHQDILHYQTSTYLKVSSWLIVHNFDSVARCVLKLRDVLSSFKHR